LVAIARGICDDLTLDLHLTKHGLVIPLDKWRADMVRSKIDFMDIVRPEKREKVARERIERPV
jgi:hypothetical protein